MKLRPGLSELERTQESLTPCVCFATLGANMINIGKFNQLPILRRVDFGLYLDGGEKGDILLPRKYAPKDCQIGDLLEVFVCYDSEDRLVATTEKPLAQVGEFAVLKVTSTTTFGAFLNWGLTKDLLLPFAEQTRRLQPGDTVVVFVYLDNTSRIAATMRLERQLEKKPADYQVDQEVELLIYAQTELGFKALINHQHTGMLYRNEVFQPLAIGQKIKGYIRHIRAEDGKIDLALNRSGHHGAEGLGPKILECLEKSGGFLAITDKTPPEKIYKLFGVSKKKFKIALGGLYKQRLIAIDEDGLRPGPALTRVK